MDNIKLYAYRAIWKENYLNNRLRKEWNKILLYALTREASEVSAIMEMTDKVIAAYKRLQAYKERKQREQWERERLETERRLKEMDEQERRLNNCATTL